VLFLCQVTNAKFKLFINNTDEFRSNEELFLKSKKNKIIIITSCVWPLRISKSLYLKFPFDCPVFNTFVIVLYRSFQNIAGFIASTLIPAPKNNNALFE
jgi:hypothetical protein